MEQLPAPPIAARSTEERQKSSFLFIGRHIEAGYKIDRQYAADIVIINQKSAMEAGCKNTDHPEVKKLSQHEKQGTVEIETLPFVLFVEDFHQEQSASGRGVFGHGTVFRSQHFPHALRQHAAASHFKFIRSIRSLFLPFRKCAFQSSAADKLFLRTAPCAFRYF